MAPRTRFGVASHYPVSVPSAKRLPPAYLLIPLMLASLGLAFALWLFAGWTICGMFGCYPGGAFVADGGFATAAFALLCSGAVAAIPLWTVPWTTNRRLRTWVGATTPVIVALAGFLFVSASTPGWAG